MERLIVVVCITWISLLGAQPVAAQEAAPPASMRLVDNELGEVDRRAQPASEPHLAREAPSSHSTAGRVTAELGMAVLGSGLGLVTAVGFLNLTYQPLFLPLIYVAPAVGSSLGVYFMGEKFGANGTAWATGVGATLGAGAALAGSFAYLGYSGDSPLLLGSILLAGPALGALAGYELSHGARRDKETKPVVLPVVNVDSSGNVNPALSLSMSF